MRLLLFGLCLFGCSDSSLKRFNKAIGAKYNTYNQVIIWNTNREYCINGFSYSRTGEGISVFINQDGQLEPCLMEEGDE